MIPQISEPPRVPPQTPEIDQHGGIGDEWHRSSPGGRPGRVDFAAQFFGILVIKLRERLGGTESRIEIESRGRRSPAERAKPLLDGAGTIFDSGLTRGVGQQIFVNGDGGAQG